MRLALAIFLLLLIGCAETKEVVAVSTIVKHDTVRIEIPVPTPVFVSSPCDTAEILRRYCNFQVAVKDTLGNYWYAQYRWVKKRLEIVAKMRPDTVVQQVELPVREVYPSEIVAFWHYKHLFVTIALIFFFVGFIIASYFSAFIRKIM